MKVFVYDTTLRDGTQGAGINLSVEDKLKVAKLLDELGVDYIEGGFPASNPKDAEFFNKAKDIRFCTAKLVAFGSTLHPHNHTKQNLDTLIAAQTPTITIFGKSWDLHVTKVLKTSLSKNLNLIEQTVKYFKSYGKEVIYDAEHFFDGFKANPKYALETIMVAAEAGADVIVLCDTNGGSLPNEIEDIIKCVKEKNIQKPLGIHAHNDGGLAVANTLAAVNAGVQQIQGTINGYGERCGNADLCSALPNMMLKLKYLTNIKLHLLTETARAVAEIVNITLNPYAPYVGQAAFTHKGGVHIDGVLKTQSAYEHIQPQAVGNERRLLISELAGRAGVLQFLKNMGLDFEKNSSAIKDILEKVKQLEKEGYQFEGAEASFELLVYKVFNKYKPAFNLKEYRVIVEKRHTSGTLISEATVKVDVAGEIVHTVAEGDGPVHALDNAIRCALERFYPQLRRLHLCDYKVRVLDAEHGTAAKVRVLITSAMDKHTWSTVGVSENIIDASWQALVDSIDYALLKQ